MTVHVLFDDWLYLDIDGRIEVCGPEEAARHYKPRMKMVHAAFIDCVVKRTDPSLIESAFSSDYITQHERTGPGVHQVMGALKVDIERVHHYFKPIPATSLVPYPVLIRAFLNGRDLLSANKAVVFLDDLKTQAVLTIIEGVSVSTPRRINMRDTAYMASEIQRYQKHYMSQQEEGGTARNIAFILVSNNREWLTALSERSLFAKEDIVHVDHACPALEGFKKAKFAMHFALPADIAKQKRNAVIGKYLKDAAFSIAMMAIGFFWWVSLVGNQRDLTAQINHLRQTHQHLTAEVSDISRKKITALLKQGNSVDYGHLYHDFISGTPREYLVQGFQVDKTDDNKWHFKGIIYPGDDEAIERHFQRLGLLHDATINPALANGRLGQEVVLARENTHG